MTNLDWRTILDPYPVLFVRTPLEVEKSALVIIDVQRYWTSEDGPMSGLLKENYPQVFDYFYDMLNGKLIPALAKVLNRYREVNLPVVHITTGATRLDGRDMIAHLQRRVAASSEKEAAEFGSLKLGSKWHQIVPELAPERGELVLNKTSRSAFASTGIDSTLRSLGATHLVVGGIASDGCVDLTARDASDRGYETFLLADGSGTFAEDKHRLALEGFHRMWGTVVTSDEVLKVS